jgi:sugar-specific transcriptional regulator TrmB
MKETVPDLESILQSLGLDELEVKTYLLLLRMGTVQAGGLAGKLGVPRSSLYGVLTRLKERGLIHEVTRKGVKWFGAERPEHFTVLFNQQIESLEKQRAMLQALLPELKKPGVRRAARPRLQLFEGPDGVQHVLRDMLLYSDLETLALWPIRAMLEILSPAFFRFLNKERIRQRLYTRAIWPRSQVVSVREHPYLGVGDVFRREIRVAPDEIDFTMGYWIYGDRVAFLSSTRESFGFILESAELIETLRSQFEIIWRLSTPLKVSPQDTAAFVAEIERTGARSDD